MKTIAITAGHSNTDCGAVGINLRKEADITVEMRNIVASYLKSAGVPFITDGVGKDNQPLSTAINVAKSANFAVEFHCNAGSATAKGVEVLGNPAHKVQAQALANAVANALKTTVRGDNGYKPEDSGQHSKLGYISKGNGVILELFFITNAYELSQYDNFKWVVGRNIADVLTRIAKGEL